MKDNNVLYGNARCAADLPTHEQNDSPAMGTATHGSLRGDTSTDGA